MTKKKRTMKELSYGIHRPADLLVKLTLDADKLTESPHPYDVFNFIITAAVLAEWVQQFYGSDKAPQPFVAPTRDHKFWVLPEMSGQWISDVTCLPNPHGDTKRDIANVLSICTHTANSSKHFHWRDRGDVQAIGTDPPIASFYQWFFTSTEPDLYLDFQGENYGLKQIKGILLQFYARLIEYLDRFPA